MNKAKLLEATAPPSVTVTPVPTDQNAPDPTDMNPSLWKLALDLPPVLSEEFLKFRQDIDEIFDAEFNTRLLGD